MIKGFEELTVSNDYSKRISTKDDWVGSRKQNRVSLSLS